MYLINDWALYDFDLLLHNSYVSSLMIAQRFF